VTSAPRASTHRRLKRSRIPCEQYLDMGKSVLTASREGILGKVGQAVSVADLTACKCGSVCDADADVRRRGKGNSAKDPKPVCGEEEASKQESTEGGRTQASLTAVESSLFSLTD